MVPNEVTPAPHPRWAEGGMGRHPVLLGLLAGRWGGQREGQVDRERAISEILPMFPRTWRWLTLGSSILLLLCVSGEFQIGRAHV